MNSETKLAIKLEIIRDMVDHVDSNTDQATILWLRSYSKECFDKHILSHQMNYKQFDKAIMEIKNTLKPLVPDPLTGIFLVSVVSHLIEDVAHTKYFGMLEPILDACYTMEGKEKFDCDSVEMAGSFVNKIYGML